MLLRYASVHGTILDPADPKNLTSLLIFPTTANLSFISKQDHPFLDWRNFTSWRNMALPWPYYSKNNICGFQDPSQLSRELLSQYALLNAVVIALFYNLLNLRNQPARTFRTVLFSLAPLGMIYHLVSPFVISLGVLLYTRSAAQARSALRQQIGLLPPDQLIEPPTLLSSEQAASNFKSPIPPGRSRRPEISYYILIMTIMALLYCLDTLYVSYNHAAADRFTITETRIAQLAFGGCGTAILILIHVLFRPIYPVELLDKGEPLERACQIRILRDPMVPVLIDLCASGLGFGLVFWIFHPRTFNISEFPPDLAKEECIPCMVYPILGMYAIWLCFMPYISGCQYRNDILAIRDNELALTRARGDYWFTVVFYWAAPIWTMLSLLAAWCLLRGFLDHFTVVWEIWSMDASVLLQQYKAGKDI